MVIVFAIVVISVKNTVKGTILGTQIRFTSLFERRLYRMAIIMLLVIDIGNTNITLGCYKNDELIFVSRMYTSRKKSGDEFAFELIELLKLHDVSPLDFSGAIISSVVPEILHEIIYSVQMTLKKTPLVVGEEYNGNFKVDILPISQLGADLIAVSIGAIEKYPMPCLIADLGTATKIVVLDENGKFIGCTISPGVKISLEALAKQTSLLPSISLTVPKKTVGTNTTECMQSGIVFGTAAMLDGLTDRIIEELNIDKATIVATGGYAKGIVPCCKQDIIFDKNLILDGLKAIYDRAQK